MYIRGLQEKFNMIKRRLDPEAIEREKRAERKKGMVKGFAMGSIIAGITALFLSPDTGENNRKKAKKELEKVKDVLETNIAGSKEKLIQIYEETKEVIEDKKNVLAGKLKPDDEPDDETDILEEDFEQIENDLEEIEEDF
ncbi:MAG: YtxH domain-containing protein [Alkaliphilus sp.]|nr:YtxH domain-containing protein [Alkaliphilus sp.]